MKGHMPIAVWEYLIGEIEKRSLPVRPALAALGLSPATYYRHKKRMEEGKHERRSGSGRPKTYDPAQYEGEIKEILSQIPPSWGHRRVHRRLENAPGSLSTTYRVMRDLCLLLPPKKGKSKKRYEPPVGLYPNHIWLADTTRVWAGSDPYEVYLSEDAFSRKCMGAEAHFTRTADDTIEFFEPIFREVKPDILMSDGGGEFSAQDTRDFYEDHDVKWIPTPSETPEARGLMERMVKTLKEEWLDWKNPQDLPELKNALDEFVPWYNNEREHSSLEDMTPEQVYSGKCSKDLVSQFF